MNIGCVIYKKDFLSGGLQADWRFAIKGRQVKGTGLAKGDSGNAFEGNYSIVYRDNDDNVSPEYNLTIDYSSDFYLLRWYLDGVLKYSGTGMVYQDVLIAGWKSCE